MGRRFDPLAFTDAPTCSEPLSGRRLATGSTVRIAARTGERDRFKPGSFGARAGASARAATDGGASLVRAADQAVSSLSRHATRFTEIRTGDGKLPARWSRHAVVRLRPVIS